MRARTLPEEPADLKSHDCVLLNGRDYTHDHLITLYGRPDNSYNQSTIGSRLR
jgi:hypothetical protein